MNTILESIIYKDEHYYMQVFGSRVPVCFSHGKGIYLYDCDGKQYMDMIGGIAVNALGHAHPRLVKAISRQARALIHCSNYYYIEKQSELAKQLVEKSFADRVFFSNSGAEANEAAIKLARGYFYHKGAPRKKIITALQSFHGRTMTTLAATGQEKFQKPFGPLSPGFVHIPFNDLAEIQKIADEDTCAILVEPIQGESGVYPSTDYFLKSIREICDRTGALMILDEIQTGIGRTGTMFAYEQFEVTPDIMTLAKGLGGGVPIGATLATENAATGFKIGDHGGTFGGNPLSCAAGLAVLEEIEEKNLLLRVQRTGEHLKNKLEKMCEKYAILSEIRGSGLLLGIELEQPEAAAIKAKCMEHGVLVGSIGTHVIRLAPPLILTKTQANTFLKVFEAIIAAY